MSKLQIAKELGVSHTTIGRELKRNTDSMFHGLYSHLIANTLSISRRSHASKIEKFSKLTSEALTYLKDKIAVHTSPEVISGELKLNKGIDVSKNTIYRYLQADRANGGLLYKDLPHSGKPYRPAKSIASNVKIINRVGIEKRPVEANNKVEIGHLEIDTVVGVNHKSFLLTIVDKCCKYTIVKRIPNKCAETVVEAFKSIIATTLLPFKTITSDNGLEFAFHEKIAELTQSLFFFARPYRSCDRGLNEHTNGLIRRFFPKGTDFNQISDEEINRVQFILNSRGRKSLGFKSPNQILLQFLQRNKP